MSLSTKLLFEVMPMFPLFEQRIIYNYAKGKPTPYDEVIRLRNLSTALREELIKTDGYHWWLSFFPQEKAFYQMQCTTLILPSDYYKYYLKSLFGDDAEIDIFAITKEILEDGKDRYEEWKAKMIGQGRYIPAGEHF